MGRVRKKIVESHDLGQVKKNFQESESAACALLIG